GTFPAYLHKLSTCVATFDTVTASVCDTQYVSGLGNTYTNSGTYTEMTTNSGGCDSTITLQITLNYAQAGVNVSNDTLYATQTGVTYQWLDCDGTPTPIPGATAPFYLPPMSGSFAVIVNDSGCVDTSACENIVIIGLDAPAASALSLFPNPTTGRITLELPETASNLSVGVYDVRGRHLQDVHFGTANTAQMDLPEQIGLYFLKIEMGNGAPPVWRRVLRQ
ncbi:MAG: T9SS type A sorting domain-containing protein, partial [Bacteroidota bacterium]